MKRFLFYFILITIAINSKSQTNIWVGGASGNWSSNGNWSQGHYPASNENVVINTSSNISVDVFVSGFNNIVSLQVTGGATATLITPVGNTLIINGSFTVSSATSLGISGSIFVKGDVANDGIVTTGSDAVIELNGVANQNISGAGDWIGGSHLKLGMNNPAGATLVSPVLIKCYLVLNNGKLRTTATNILTMSRGPSNSSGWLGGSSASFVEGPMRNVTTGASFKFPIGKGSVFAPIQYENSLNYFMTDTFTAEYFRVNPQGVYGNNYDPVGNPEIINHISNVEYWSLVKNAGPTISGNRVVLTATANSFCTDTALDSTFAARYITGINQWTTCRTFSRESISSAPPYITGDIRTYAVPDFGIFTIATSRSNDFANGALPITLISFDAAKLNSSVSLVNWQLSELSLSAEKFEIQRAGNDRNFVTIGIVSGNRTNRFYNYTDNDLKTGINYYRLKMIDENGKITYSRTVAVMNGVNGLLLTSLIPTVVTNNATLTVASSGQQKLDIIIVDMQGRAVLRRNFTIASGNTNIDLSLTTLAAGVYQLTGISTEGKINTIPFIKQ